MPRFFYHAKLALKKSLMISSVNFYYRKCYLAKRLISDRSVFSYRFDDCKALYIILISQSISKLILSDFF